ncbi:MAG: CBS domain-containing protein, partial [Verrucomicrobia bacterium]|nr:CBS domain-containing protein [Verrucomicrobiota bacterium]
ENAWEPLSGLGIAEGGMIERLLAVNVGLVIFNMLPAFPMDGGRVLRAALAMKMNYTNSTIIAARVGKVMAALFAICGLFTNPMLILIAVFVWSGSTQESSLAKARSIFTGATVRDAMVTSFHTVTPSTTLQEMVALMLSGAQHDYPVIKRDHLIGMLAFADLLSAMQTYPLDTPVITFMRTDVPRLNETELLDDVLTRDCADDKVAIPVLKHGVLVGLLTAENMHEYFIIREAHRGIDLAWSRGVRVVRDSAA